MGYKIQYSVKYLFFLFLLTKANSKVYQQSLSLFILLLLYGGKGLNRIFEKYVGSKIVYMVPQISLSQTSNVISTF